MGDSYAFKGDEIIGGYVSRCFQGLDCQRVADVEDAQVVFSHCYHADAIEDLYFENEGLIKHARPGTLLVDLSAATPSLARELSAVAAVNDLRFVEAPLAVLDPFASRDLASSATMACYVSGEDDDCDAVSPYLNALAARVYPCGPFGAAQLAKAINTTLMASQVVSAIEANALFHSLHERGFAEGDDPLLAVPFGDAYEQVQKLVAQGDFQNAYTIALFMSDVVAAMNAADDGELILPQLEAAMHILELFGVIGGADKGLAALELLYRDEDEGAAAGLDWTRAEKLYGDPLGGEENLQDYGDDFDDYGFADGFGDYSEN